MKAFGAASLPQMSAIALSTTQNVNLQVEVATIVSRGLALVIDWVVLAGYSILLGWLINELNVRPSPGGWLILIGVPWTFYHLAMEVFMDGQSIGKRMMKIKVVRMNGGGAGLTQYLLRWMLRIVDSFFLVGALVILFNGKGQRLGDLAAGTTVVSVKKRFKLTDGLFTEVPPGHQVAYPQATMLSDANARLIKDVLADGSAARAHALEVLAQRMAQGLGVKAPADSEAFLGQLLMDYIHLTSR